MLYLPSNISEIPACPEAPNRGRKRKDIAQPKNASGGGKPRDSHLLSYAALAGRGSEGEKIDVMI
jgi:hypothetical protein